MPIWFLLVVLVLTVRARLGCTTFRKKLISILWSGKPDEKAAALRSIGVPDEVAQKYKDLMASMTSEILWQRLRASGPVEEAGLFLPCLDVSDVAYLFLVDHTISGWKVQDDRSLDCHSKCGVSVELAANIIPGIDSILLHMDCDSHSPGYVEHHLHVFDPAHGKLREILNTEESVFSSGWGEESGRLRRSVLVPITSASDTTIEQTQITPSLDQQTDQPSSAGQDVRRSTRVWSSTKHRMMPTPFHQLNSRP